jgi:SAM-dependent methyltransferase
VRPADVAVADTLAYLRRALPPPPASVLEVGCGRSDLAARAQAIGYRVTAIDTDEAAVQYVRRTGVPAVHVDFHHHAGPPVDVVLFTRSLHHMPDLGAALEHARGLLTEGGRVVAEEFARELADRATATFVAGVEALLAAAGALEDGGGPEAPAADPWERWRVRHYPEGGHRLHEGGEMVRAVRARFRRVEVERCPYLYRQVGERLDETERGQRITQALADLERRLVESGSLRPVGIRIRAEG